MTNDDTPRRVRLWSGKRDLIVLCVGVAVAVLIWLGHAWIWPTYRWHLVEKPRLLAKLAQIGGPPLEALRLTGPISYEHQVTLDGVRLGSPVPVEVRDGRIVGEGFTLTITKQFPDVSPASYFAMTIGPLAVTPDDVRRARTPRERELAHDAVENRAIIAGTHYDRAAVVEGPQSQVIFFSNNKVIAGVVMANDESMRRDFCLALDGLDRAVAEQMVYHLQCVGEEK